METPPICDYEGSDYQATFWEHGERDYEDAVEAVALRRLLPPGGQRMLELGAGAGRNTARYTGFEQVTLLDYSRSQLEQAHQRLGENPHYRYVVANIYHLPFTPGLFDAATLIRTLHHLSEPRRALEQIRTALQPGASFILEFANKQNLKAILRFALRQQSWNPFSPEPIEFAPLNYDFHPATVRAWLRSSGFAIQRQLSVSHLRMGFLKRALPLRWLVAWDSLFQWTGEFWQYTPSIFICSRAMGTLPGLATPGSFFRCPACGQELPDTPPLITCESCGQKYPVEGGIYDFRITAYE